MGKVIEEEKVFRPITLVLETELEALAIYYSLGTVAFKTLREKIQRIPKYKYVDEGTVDKATDIFYNELARMLKGIRSQR